MYRIFGQRCFIAMSACNLYGCKEDSTGCTSSQEETPLCVKGKKQENPVCHNIRNQIRASFSERSSIGVTAVASTIPPLATGVYTKA